MRFQLTIVRHGETDWNKNQLVQSYSDVPLNETGRLQAAALGAHLKGERFTKIYASDLIRTHQTVEGILGNSHRNFIKDVRLTEKGFGEAAEGKCGKELFANVMAAPEPVKYLPPGGETYESVRTRAASFFKDLVQEFIDNPSFVEENLLVVTHGGWILHLVDFFDTEPNYEFVDVNEEKAKRKDFLRPLKNTGVIKFEVVMSAKSTFRIKWLVFNDCSHLLETV